MSNKLLSCSTYMVLFSVEDRVTFVDKNGQIRCKKPQWLLGLGRGLISTQDNAMPCLHFTLLLQICDMQECRQLIQSQRKDRTYWINSFWPHPQLDQPKRQQFKADLKINFLYMWQDSLGWNKVTDYTLMPWLLQGKPCHQFRVSWPSSHER